jgi:hypothetical protein
MNRKVVGGIAGAWSEKNGARRRRDSCGKSVGVLGTPTRTVNAIRGNLGFLVRLLTRKIKEQALASDPNRCAATNQVQIIKGEGQQFRQFFSLDDFGDGIQFERLDVHGVLFRIMLVSVPGTLSGVHRANCEGIH